MAMTKCAGSCSVALIEVSTVILPSIRDITSTPCSTSFAIVSTSITRLAFITQKKTLLNRHSTHNCKMYRSQSKVILMKIYSFSSDSVKSSLFQYIHYFQIKPPRPFMKASERFYIQCLLAWLKHCLLSRKHNEPGE